MNLNGLDREDLLSLIASLREENTYLKQEVNFLKEQLEWLKRQLFGVRSEKLKPLNHEQLEFEGFDSLNKEKPETKIVKQHERKKPNRNGQDKITLPDDIPVKTTILDVPESEKICPDTGKALVKIGEEKSYRLAHQPGSYYLKEIIRPKYAHPIQKDQGIKIADLPDSIISKCRADESLLAEIAVQKFGDHLPLYRMTQIMERSQIQISRKLLSQWMVKVGLALEPLYREMTKKILQGDQLFIDETPIKLQAKTKCKQAYLWVMVGGGNSPNPPYKIYDFRENRKHQHGLDLLQGYRGTIHSDKYGAYEKIAKITQVKWQPCWAHIRRKFFEIPGEDPFKSEVLRKIKYLFLLEKVGWNRSPEERLKIRKEKEEPIIDELIKNIKGKLADRDLLPKSKKGDAVKYFCGLIGHLKTYLTRAYTSISNNVAERAIRPVAIGRKNWLFFGSEQGGKAGGILLSLIQTCRGLGINPRDYLEDIFRRIMSHPAKKVAELLPDQWLLHQKKSQPL